MSAAAVPSHLADRRRLASLRTAPPSAGARPTARPSFALADVIAIGGEPALPRAVDTPKVQAHNRLYLPASLAELGWGAGEQVRVWVDEGHAVITAGTAGRGKSRTVGSGDRLTLAPASMTALGGQPGSHLVALVPPDGSFLLLLGPAGLAAVADLLLVPPHVRTLIERLDGLDVTAAVALERLASKLTSAELDALARISPERLRELGLVETATTAIGTEERP